MTNNFINFFIYLILEENLREHFICNIFTNKIKEVPDDYFQFIRFEYEKTKKAFFFHDICFYYLIKEKH